MSQFPQYVIAESELLNMQSSLNQRGYHMACTRTKHLIPANNAFYREWEITDQQGAKIIMWDEHGDDRKSNESAVVVTLGNSSGKVGRMLLKEVQSTLVEFGASKRGPAR